MFDHLTLAQRSELWFALPLVGFGEAAPFEAAWVRILLIAVVWLTVGTVYLVRFLRRRRAAKALEAALTEQEVTGDGEVLGEKMTEAMAVLKKSSGSKSFLYDLPWYIIIGPPGSGKTTALLNSGVKFPLAEKGEGAVAEEGCTPLRRHARLLRRSGGVTAHPGLDVPCERAART